MLPIRQIKTTDLVQGSNLVSEPAYIQCPYCAEEIRAEAKKCRYCGEWLDGSNDTVLPKWETCEISWTYDEYHVIANEYDYRLVANAVGEKGRYVTEASPTWFRAPGWGDSRGGSASPEYAPPGVLDALITELTKHGWEALPGKGDYWFSYRFRRVWSDKQYEESCARVQAVIEQSPTAKKKKRGLWRS